jgi:hypothetical protein
LSPYGFPSPELSPYAFPSRELPTLLTTCAAEDPPAETPVRETTGEPLTGTGVPVVLVELDVVLVPEPDVLVTRGVTPDDPDAPVTETTGVPIG